MGNVVFGVPFGRPHIVHSECGKYASYPLERREMTLEECEYYGEPVGTQVWDAKVEGVRGKFLGWYDEEPIRNKDWPAILIELE